MSKYIPPSKRPGYVPPSTSMLPPGYDSRPTDTRARVDDLSKQFNHTQSSTFTFFNTPIPPNERKVYKPRTKVDLHTNTEQTTISLEREVGDQHPLSHIISYIVIFPNAHPAWNPQQQLWTHTNANVIIDDYKGSKKNFDRPIPVFTVVETRRDVTFTGWYLLDSVNVVEPGSDELKRLLEAKEDGKSYNNGRTREAWAQSLKETWIKINLVPAPPSSGSYAELKDPMTLKGGADGEVGRYLLEVGGLTEEIDILVGMQGVA